MSAVIQILRGYFLEELDEYSDSYLNEVHKEWSASDDFEDMDTFVDWLDPTKKEIEKK
jgi:hypothetical protein